MIRLLVFTSLLLLIAARPPEETNEIEAIPSAQPTPDYKKLYNLEKKKNLKNAATAPTTSTTDSSLVEYHINHEISQPSAKEAAREINLEDCKLEFN